MFMYDEHRFIPISSDKALISTQAHEAEGALAAQLPTSSRPRSYSLTYFVTPLAVASAVCAPSFSSAVSFRLAWPAFRSHGAIVAVEFGEIRR